VSSPVYKIQIYWKTIIGLKLRKNIIWNSNIRKRRGGFRQRIKFDRPIDYTYIKNHIELEMKKK
jgi:hypothetical protein